MKVTGYGLREALKEQELLRDTAAGAFTPSLRAFPGDDSKNPLKTMEQFEIAERRLAGLQTAQMRYNLKVLVDVQGERMSLGEAIKRVGSVGRIEKMWKDAIQDKARSSYMDDSDVRDPTQIRAVRTVEPSAAMELARVAGKKANAFRSAIAIGNGVEVDIDGLDSSLFG